MPSLRKTLATLALGLTSSLFIRSQAAPVFENVTFRDSRIIYEPEDQWKTTSDGQGRFSISPGSSISLNFTGSTVHIIGARANGGSSSFLITLDTLTFIGTSRSSGSDGKLVNQTLFDSGFVPALDASLPQHCIRIEHTGEPGEAVDFARFEIGHETRAGPSSASVVPVPSPLPDAFLSSDNPLAPASATVSSALPGTPTSRSSEALSAQTVQVMSDFKPRPYGCDEYP
ncbi:hypothetical protein EMMF5_002395 [Cystobasidiomycetes sp. EMM_F5]